jgi:transcriptional regulator with XRE-family HTH domain
MSTSHDEPIRHYLREWREHRGLHQEQLAKMVGTSKSVISRFEIGERHMKFEMQIKIMRALKITPPQFFSPPDPNLLENLVARLTPSDRPQVAKIVKTYVPDDK